MCNLIITFCPVCTKVAAPSRVQKCSYRSDAAHTPKTTKITAMNPCIRCRNCNKPSNPTGILTRDILEDMCMRIPEWHPTAPQEPVPGIFPSWNSETLSRAQDEELFLEHVTQIHSVEVKNRQGLTSQRKGFPLYLMAGIKQRPSPVNQRLVRSRPERSKFTLPPLAWNNNPRIRRLGIAPAPRAAFLQPGSARTGTASRLIPSENDPRSQHQEESFIASSLAREPLRLQIPPQRSSSTETQDTKSTPSSTTSARSEYLLPGPSPQTETFSATAFAQIPAHYDMRRTSIPTPAHVSTTQQQVQVRKQHDTIDQVPREHEEERKRQNLENERMRKLQQRNIQTEQRIHSETISSRNVNDVQFNSVRPKRSLELLPKISSFGSFWTPCLSNDVRVDSMHP